MVYKDLTFNEYAHKMFDQLQKGAFITTKKEEKVNTMTIAWGGISFLWKKPVWSGVIFLSICLKQYRKSRFWAGLKYNTIDGFVKSPTSALCCISQSFNVR